jgi:hypothetical protein
MRSLVLLFLIFLVRESLSAIPVRCAVRRQALLSVETETLEPCITDKSRPPICQFACKNEIIQFINLKNFDHQFKSQYFTYCKGNYCDCRVFADSIGQTNWFNLNVVALFCPADVTVKPAVQINVEPLKNSRKRAIRVSRATKVTRPNQNTRIQKVGSRRAIVDSLSDEINEEIRSLENEMEEFE